MNRIRQVGKVYQTLISPHQKYDVGFEYMLGSWTDEGMMGFEVKEYNTYFDAECEATNHPDINWDQLVDYHKDSYTFLKHTIQTVLDNLTFIVRFDSKLLTPEQTKNKMFERVLEGHDRVVKKNDTSGFRTVYDMNDIISFVITNPWSKNLTEIQLHLLRTERLNIFSRIEKNNIIHLIGRTELGTTYEIILIPDILYNWIKWRNANSNLSEDRHYSSLRNCIKTQRMIDATPVLR
jgi:hypothetical protein